MFGFVDPESGLGILISVKMLIMAALGGAGLLFGPLVGLAEEWQAQGATPDELEHRALEGAK